MQQSATTNNLTLDEVKLHFDHWRATRAKRGKIPDSLWSEVKALIGHYPTNKIAQTLGVNAYQISTGVNNKLSLTFVAARPAGISPQRIKTLSACSEEKCALEFHRPSGGFLKINEFPVTSLVSLINQFME
jgi:hypothetical protein